MKRSLLFLLLMALFMPWAAQAQTRETLTFDFEDQTIPSTWTNDANYPWVVVSESQGSGHSGTYCIKSGNSGVSSSSSTISATFNFNDDGTISFLGSCFGEGTSTAWDKCIFKIDGTQQFAYGALQTWETYTFNVTAGEHTFTWSFTKDSSVNATGDAFFVDDIVVDLGEVQAFPKPTNLAVSNILHNSATLSWTENGTATSWQLCINGDEDNPTTINTNPYTLTNLTASTAYTVKVRSVGNGEYSAWSNEVSFSTTAVVGDAWSDDFEGETCGWELINGTLADAWVWGTATNNGGTHAIYISDDGGTAWNYSHNSVKVLAAKLLTFTEGKFTFSYDWNCYGESSYDFLRVALVPASQTLTAGSDYSTISTTSLPTGWIALDGGGKLNQVQTWQNKEVAVNVTAGNYYLVFAWRSDSSTQNQPPAAVDNVSITRVACPYDVTGLAVSEITSNSATLSWNVGEATQWQVAYGTDSNFEGATEEIVNTASYNLSGLQSSSIYYVKVRAYCGGEDFGTWCQAITFTTEVACPAPVLTIVESTPIATTFSWTGEAQGYEMEYMVNPSFTFEDGTLQGWTNLIVNADGGQWLHSNDNPGGYMDPTASDNPYYPDLAHNGTGFAMCYSFIDNDGAYNTEAYLVSPRSYLINNGASMNFWYDMANDSYPEYFEVCVATAANPTADDFTAIWTSDAKGSNGQKDAVRHRNTRYQNWREVTIDLSAYAGQTIWIAFHDVNEDMYEVWIDDVMIDDGTIEWTPAPAPIVSPYTLALEPETEYLVRVRAICGGDDGESAWTTITFTTPSNCDAPYDLNVTNLMPTTATLNWTGYQDGFEVWYRPVAQGSELEAESFEGSLNGWTTIDADGDSYNWDLASVIMAGYNIPSHEGEDCVTSQSYDSDAGPLTPDNYLVSPQVELGGSITFWACAQDADYPAEHFGVAVSTTSNTDASAFTTIQEWTMTAKKSAGVSKSIYDNGNYQVKKRGNRASGNWYQYTVDLKEYAGQTGYVAIRHFDCTDMFYLNVDDVIIYSPNTGGEEEQEWIMASTDATSLDIEDLSPETTYEWQVRGENRSCTNGEDEGFTAWSEMGNFTTPGDCDPLADLKIDELTATSITLSWTGYQESYNVQYRTAAIIDYYFEDWFDEGLSNWTEDNPSDNNNTYDVSSGIMGYVFWMDENTTGAQTIISTEMEPTTRGTLLDFYSASEGNSTYKIGFSSTDNALASFTWSEELTCVGDGYFHNYQGEVPEGTKYFAIQFVSNDNEEGYFIITGFEVSNIVAEAGEWITFEGVNSPYTINGLDSETEYEVYVQGVCSEGTTEWVGGNFTTPELTTITQTTELVKGWNWFSTYIEMNDVNGLDMLKESLGENGLVIRNSEVYTEYDGEWFGDLDDVPMTNEEMYMIETSEACTVTLTGMAADPANHPITINPGWNWIGFPYSQELPIEVALANFNAEEGDMFRNSEVYTEFDGEVWFGDVETLSPGQGFMYFSNSQTTKTVYYNTGSKANRSTNRILNHKKNAIDKHVIGSLKLIKKIK